MRHDDFSLKELSEALIDTAESLDYMISEMYPGMDEADLTKAEHDKLDEYIIECENCGWWTDAQDTYNSKDGEILCESCYSNQDFEEDEE